MLKYLTALLILVFALYLGNKFRKTPGEIVETTSGKVQGIVSVSRDGRAFYEWLSIPYAKPPVGALRFASPQPAERWTEILDTSSYKAICAHAQFIFSNQFYTSEDCLHLHVFVPKDAYHRAKSDGKLLPVIFFIHGGYFQMGRVDALRPNYFMDEDIVLVVIQYRVGALGFLSTQDENIRGNMGLKDQNLALRWTKQNAERFGGDPDRITVMGSSAGGVSTNYHMISPKSKDLFSRAISQSGTALARWGFTHDPLTQAKYFAKNVGCPTDSTKKMAECLRNADVYDIVKAHEPTQSSDRRAIDMFTPVVETIADDDAFLTEHPSKLYEEGRFAKIPWIVGIDDVEGVILTFDAVMNETYRNQLKEDWEVFDDFGIRLTKEESKKYSKKIRELYFGRHDDIDVSRPEDFQAYTELASDVFLNNAALKTIRLHAKYAPVYPYKYAKKGKPLMDVVAALQTSILKLLSVVVRDLWYTYVLNAVPEAEYELGVGHGFEVAMLFSTDPFFACPSGYPLYNFSKGLIKSLVGFANGNEPELMSVKYPKVIGTKEVKYLRLDDEPTVISHAHLERYRIWEEMGLV